MPKCGMISEINNPNTRTKRSTRRFVEGRQ
jgi:hypothetical protein